jgi:hypothetical protein
VRAFGVGARPMRTDLEVVEPPGRGETVELIHALTWAKLRHSVGLDSALEKTRFEIGVSERQLRSLLQSSWRKVASLACEGKLEVWGTPIYDGHFDGAVGWRGRSTRQLSQLELRNCRFLSWPFDSKAKRRMPRLERYPDTYSGSWKRHGQQSADEFDFVRVTVSRTGLLNEFGRPAPKEIRRRLSEAKIRRAVNEASDILSAGSPALLASLTRSDIMTSLIHKHELSSRHRGEADTVWKQLITQFLARSGLLTARRPQPSTTRACPVFVRGQPGRLRRI